MFLCDNSGVHTFFHRTVFPCFITYHVFARYCTPSMNANKMLEAVSLELWKGKIIPQSVRNTLQEEIIHWN